jgi:hypothetical protein
LCRAFRFSGLTVPAVVTAKYDETATNPEETVVNHFNALLDDLAALDRRRACAQNGAFAQSNAMVDAGRRRPARRDLPRLVEVGRVNRRPPDLAKAWNALLSDLTAMEKAMVKSSPATAAEMASKRHAETAMRMHRILQEIDAAMAAGKLTAIEVGVLENAFAAVAQKLGL